MFKKIINRIVIFFTLILGFDVPKTKEKYQESTPIFTISKEQQQKELYKFLTEECVIYDPNSSEAIAELEIMHELVGEINGEELHEIECNDNKLRNYLIGKTNS